MSSAREDRFFDNLRWVRENDPGVTLLEVDGSFECIQNMTDEEWEQMGRDISSSSHLQELNLEQDALDDHKMSFLFRGLTMSSSIRQLSLCNHRFGFNGVQSMLPFLQNANSLRSLDLTESNITSEGFSLLFRALSVSPIVELDLCRCGLSSIEIDDDSFPVNLKYLTLTHNNINADGCRDLTKLLRRENATLTHLLLGYNNIDDEGMAILVDALQTNSSLKILNLHDNNGITIEGMKLLLKLVNDVSSIKATLQSNHTLQLMSYNHFFYGTDVGKQIDQSLQINKENENNPDAAGKDKVIQTQLNSEKRADMCRLQGPKHTAKPLTELDPLLLPEVLELVGKHHGLSEFYNTFRTSVADLWPTINREAVLQQKREELSKELKALATKMLEVENQITDVDMEIAAIRQQSPVESDAGLHVALRVLIRILVSLLSITLILRAEKTFLLAQYNTSNRI